MRILSVLCVAAALSFVAVVPPVAADTAPDGSPDPSALCENHWGSTRTDIRWPDTAGQPQYFVHCFNQHFEPGDNGDMWPPTSTRGIIDCYSSWLMCWEFPPDNAAGDVNNDGAYDYSASSTNPIDDYGIDCAQAADPAHCQSLFGTSTDPVTQIPEHSGLLNGWLKGSGCTQAGVRFEASYLIPSPWGAPETATDVWVQCWQGDTFASGLGSDSDKWTTLAVGEALVDCWRGQHPTCEKWVKQG